MPDYKIYPGVDELFNFPPQIREAFAQSMELATELPPVVTDILSQNTTVRTAAEAAVGDAMIKGGALGSQPIEVQDVAVSFVDDRGSRSFMEAASDGSPSNHSADLIVKKITPALDAPLKEITGIEDVGDQTGWAWAVRDSEGYVALGLREDGTMFPELDRDPADVLVKKAIHEWWIEPIAFWQNSPYPRLIHGAYSTTGQILVCEKPESGISKTVIVGKTGNTDDHNTPAVFEVGSRIAAVWQEHNADHLLKFAISDPDGSLNSMVANPIQQVGINGACSYAQVIKINHLSDATQTTFFVITRRDTNDWGFLRIKIMHDTAGISLVTPYTTLLSAGGQSYITMEEAHGSGNQKVRFAWGYNPAHTNHAVFFLELDLVTGAITSPGSSFTANLSGTNLPITYASNTAILPETATGWSRRLYYTRPGPYRQAVAYADFQEGAWESTAELKLIEWTGSAWDIKSYGLIGRAFSATNESYGGGPGFPNPCYNDKIAYPQTVNGVSQMVVRQTVRDVDTQKVIAESTWPLGRAVFPKNGNPIGVIYAEIYRHVNAGLAFDSTLQSAKEL